MPFWAKCNLGCKDALCVDMSLSKPSDMLSIACCQKIIYPSRWSQGQYSTHVHRRLNKQDRTNPWLLCMWRSRVSCPESHHVHLWHTDLRLATSFHTRVFEQQPEELDGLAVNRILRKFSLTFCLSKLCYIFIGHADLSTKDIAIAFVIISRFIIWPST